MKRQRRSHSEEEGGVILSLVSKNAFFRRISCVAMCVFVVISSGVVPPPFAVTAMEEENTSMATAAVNGHRMGNNIPPPVMSTIFPPPSGPIQDATCDVEQLELANDSQLYTILYELRNTAFFRSFAVDLSERCPLSTWGKKKTEPVTAEKTSTEQITDSESISEPEPVEQEQDETSQCVSNGIPDLDPDAKPACSVEAGDDDSSFMPWQKAGTSATPLGSAEESSYSQGKKPVEDDIPSLVSEDEEYACDGGSEELDEDAPPLCELSEEDMKPATPIRDLISSALKSIAEQFGWESESQKKTFSWSKLSDPVVIDEDDIPCDDQHDGGALPDTFWVDMCSNIKVGDGVKLVNLALNPERNTGYNGTHIWKAIYEENCIKVDAKKNAPMCYEERVLYRLLSGLHASTTISIAKNYYPPSKRKGRKNWEPNAQYFMDRFGENPDYIRNLHFSYVVLLRALRKASPFLYDYEIRTGNIVEDETATVLLKRLLDSHILRSCQHVFTAFDESLMFKEEEATTDNHVISLQQNFKGVFHNISSILDCVQCEQCKLHGKMAMLGYGTALKILFLPREELIASSLSRNEVVAFINTIAKLSESIKEVRELTHLYWESQSAKDMKQSLPPTLSEIAGGDEAGITGGALEVDLIDAAVGAVAKLQHSGLISESREAELVRLALARDPKLLVLAKHYRNNLQKFLQLSESIGSLGGESVDSYDEPDAIVVGSGLAGLAATLNILDRGGKVVVIEKEHRLGGNSNKASSGINACCPQNDTYGDDLESFKNDTIKSAGEAAQLTLIETLVGNSADAVTWLKERVGVDLSLLAQLGGHSHKRTHRPSNGMVGAEIIYGMQKAVKAYEKSGMVEILVDSQVTNLITDDEGRVTGVEIETRGACERDIFRKKLFAANVVLATGGFAADRSSGSYMEEYRPELLKMPATAGEFSSGDGIRLATTLGAGTVDMDKVQVHPTGWVDPADPTSRSKVLAAELMRGVGGILINGEGQRFCNELGTRAYVTDMMLSHDPYYAATKKWNASSEIPTFSLVLSSSAADDGRKHVDLYTHKGLMKRLEGVSALADWMGIDEDIVRSTLKEYQFDAEKGEDKWGKKSFRGVPQSNLDEEVFYAGTVTPVLHYCMGGITIDTEGNVLNKDGKIIAGLHAAGEVTGGVHGNNRLGGNSLLECTVYGTIVGKKIPIRPRKHFAMETGGTDQKRNESEIREVSLEQLQKHNSPQDCWVAIHGVVYDLTEFAEEHPPGAESIFKLAGKDGTEAFSAVHNKDMLNDFEEDKVGLLIA